MVHRIYSTELQLNKAYASDTEAAFLDLNLSIHNDTVSKTSSPKGNDRSPDNKQVFLNSSQVSKRFFSIGQEQLTLQSMV